MRYAKPDSLRDYVVSLLAKVGVPEDEGGHMAHGLVLANLRGVNSHGVSRMPIYMKSFSLDLIRARAEWSIEAETASSVAIDAKNSIGAVTGVRVMELLQEKARDAGVVMASVRNSTHFGMSAHFAMMPLEKDMIGFAVSNSPMSMAPWGGVEPFTGTNPLACAVPAGKALPIVLDMATSVAAKGKIILALDAGGVIPEGWALDRKGVMTTSAEEAMQGTVMPIGGPKGFGLSLLIDIVSSCLSGGAFGPHVNNLYKTFDKPQDICHAFGVINVARFISVDFFKNRIDEIIREIKASPRAPGVDEIRLPGEIEFLTQTRREREGVPLPMGVLTELEQLGKDFAVPFPVESRTEPYGGE
jgi:LDH2 family malate/lactate/ureidoglycolate dehydrogenase